MLVQREVPKRKHAPDGATPPGTAPLAPQSWPDGAPATAPGVALPPAIPWRSPAPRARRLIPEAPRSGSPALGAQSREGSRHRGIKIKPPNTKHGVFDVDPVGHALALAFSDGKPVRGAAGSSASRAAQGLCCRASLGAEKANARGTSCPSGRAFFRLPFVVLRRMRECRGRRDAQERPRAKKGNPGAGRSTPPLQARPKGAQALKEEEPNTKSGAPNRRV